MMGGEVSIDDVREYERQQLRQVEISLSTRIRQLERLNESLSAEIDRQRKLIDVVLTARELPAEIVTAINEYDASGPK